MLTLLVILGAGLCAAVPLEQGTRNGWWLEHPEDNPDLFEGDIVLQPGDNPLHPSGVAGRKFKRWPNGVLPYKIANNQTAKAKEIIMLAIRHIEWKTKVNGTTCIHFKPRTNEHTYVNFKTGKGCSATIGSTKPSYVVVGSGCWTKGLVVHEILHVLGFLHEQNRSDRDKYVVVHEKNIQDGRLGNFKKYKSDELDLLGKPYNYNSIMHYSANVFAKDPNKPTLTPLRHGAKIGQRKKLSLRDIKEIQLLYGCIQSGHHSE